MRKLSSNFLHALPYTLLYLWISSFASTLVFGLPLTTTNDANLTSNFAAAAGACTVAILLVAIIGGITKMGGLPSGIQYALSYLGLATSAGIAWMVLLYSDSIQRESLMDFLRISSTCLIALTIIFLAAIAWREVSDEIHFRR